MKALIRGIGTVGGFGSGIDALERALVRGSAEHQWIEFETTRGEIRLPGYRVDTSALSQFVPIRVLRRMAHTSRMALAGAFSALADAALMDWDQRGRLGIIVATGYGATCNNFDFQHLSDDGADFSGSPTRFSNSVHNAAAANISIALKARGPNHSVSHLDMSFPSALLTALQWLREDRTDTVLVGGVDEFSKAMAYAWRQMPAATAGEAQRALIGEGAAFFVLSRSESDASSGYGVIEDVAVQHTPRNPGLLPPAAAHIMGIQDLTLPGGINARLPQDARLAAYAHLYGITPVAAAFDLAVAALSLKLGTLFPSMALPAGPALPNTLSDTQPLGQGPLCCFQSGVGETFGSITIGPHQSSNAS
jgi:3-oxoacyl-[acyl-carrier-protein] synthase II